MRIKKIIFLEEIFFDEYKKELHLFYPLVTKQEDLMFQDYNELLKSLFFQKRQEYEYSEVFFLALYKKTKENAESPIVLQESIVNIMTNVEVFAAEGVSKDLAVFLLMTNQH